MKRRILSLALALVMVMTFLPVTKAEAAASYSVNAAITYAKAHWNDGVGMCAEFVSKCIRAGGLNMNVIKTTKACINAVSSASGLPIVEVKLDANGYALQSLNSGILSAGDPVIQKCVNPNCLDYGKHPHIMLCGGFDSQGRATFYGHTAAINNKVQKLNVNEGYNHTKACTMKVYTVHVASLDKGGGTVTPPVTTPSVTFTPPTDPAYTAKYKVSNTNAVLVTQVKKASGVACTQMGMYLYDASGKLLKKHSESISQNSITPSRTAPYHSWYDVNSEVGYTLTPGTTYKYQFFGIFNGVEVKGGTYSFTTTGTPPASTKNIPVKIYLNSEQTNSKIVYVKEGQALGTLPTPEAKEGYTFDGYYTSTSGGNKVSATTIVRGVDYLNLYPRYTKNAVEQPAAATVYYYADGQIVMTQSTTVGSKYYTTPYERKGYTFLGWFDEGAGGTNYSGGTITASSPRILYGQYEKEAEKQYTVSFYSNGSLLQTKTVTNGSTYGALPTASLSGYTFQGWYTKASGGTKITSSTKVNLTGSQTLYARFEAVEVPASGNIILQINNPTMYINGRPSSIDAQGTVPVIRNDRTLLPVRAVFEAMGGTVGWDNDTRIVTLNLDGKILYLQIGTAGAIDGDLNKYYLDTAPVIINNRTMLPIRFIVEFFDGTVEWDGDTRTVLIRY